MNAGKLELDREQVDMPGVVEDAVEHVRPAADAKQLEIEVALQPVEVPADPHRVEQRADNVTSVEGEGTAFTVEAAAVTDDQRPLVLVADDEDDIRALVCYRMEKAGYDVVSAADGDEAIKPFSPQELRARVQAILGRR